MGTSEFVSLIPSNVPLTNTYIIHFLPDYNTDMTQISQDYRLLVPNNQRSFTSFEGFVNARFILTVLSRFSVDGFAVTDIRSRFLDEIYSNTIFN